METVGAPAPVFACAHKGSARRPRSVDEGQTPMRSEMPSTFAGMRHVVAPASSDMAKAESGSRLWAQGQIEPDIVESDAWGQRPVGSLLHADQPIALHRLQRARQVGLGPPGALDQHLQ